MHVITHDMIRMFLMFLVSCYLRERDLPPWSGGDLSSSLGFWWPWIDLGLVPLRQLTNKNSEQRVKNIEPLRIKIQIPSTEIEKTEKKVNSLGSSYVRKSSSGRPHWPVFKRKRSCFAPFSKRFASTLIVFVLFSPVHMTTPNPFRKRFNTLCAHAQMNSTHVHFNISAHEIGAKLKPHGSVCPPFWILTVEWSGSRLCLFWWCHRFQIASFSPSTLENSVFKKYRFQIAPLWRAFSIGSVFSDRFRRCSVDDSRIRSKPAPFTFENGLVWTGPQMKAFWTLLFMWYCLEVLKPLDNTLASDYSTEWMKTIERWLDEALFIVPCKMVRFVLQT